MIQTVYVSIGNSDDKLTQQEWARFVSSVSITIRSTREVVVHGQWLSEPASAWQNACWCFEVREDLKWSLTEALRDVAKAFRQDSIAWAEVRHTLFLG